MNEQIMATANLFTEQQLTEARNIIQQLYSDTFQYTIEHLDLCVTYADRIMSHFPELTPTDKEAIQYAANFHDLMKGKNFDPKGADLDIYGHKIYQDAEKYVQENIDYLKLFGLETYLYSDLQFHAMAAAIFVMKELHVTDERVLYGIFFHSCPIPAVYDTLSDRLKLIIDIVVLADKLSANKLRPTYGKKIPFDLHLVVFGASDNEFNFTTGLYLARLIGQGKSKDPSSKRMTEHYYQRMLAQNPILKLMAASNIDITLKQIKKIVRFENAIGATDDEVTAKSSDVSEKKEETDHGETNTTESTDSDGGVGGCDATSVT